MASIVAANSVAAGRRGGLAVVLLAAVLGAPWRAVSTSARSRNTTAPVRLDPAVSA